MARNRTSAVDPAHAARVVASGSEPVSAEALDALQQLGVARTTRSSGRDAHAPSGDSAPPPPPAAWTQLPLEDQAYLLHLRGHSLRAIAARLGIDKDTANRHVRALTKEQAPRRKEARDRQLAVAVARFRAIAAAAGDQFDASGEAALLNTMATCEREIARLRGLYETLPDEDALAGGLTITITKRG